MARHGSFRSDTGSYQDEAFRSVERLEPKTYTVPETRDLLPPKQQDTPDKQQQSSSSGSDNPSSSKRGSRFRKKTLKISTGLASAFPRPPNALKRTSSVELIAAQYHAMSESRHSSRYSDEFQQFKLSPTESDTKEQIMAQRPQVPQRGGSTGSNSTNCSSNASSQRSVYHAQDYDVDDSAHVYVETPSTAGLPGPSPISDDGTLVSFQDDTVYFKPFSSAPKPDPVSPPYQEYNRDQSQLRDEYDWSEYRRDEPHHNDQRYNNYHYDDHHSEDGQYDDYSHLDDQHYGRHYDVADDQHDKPQPPSRQLSSASTAAEANLELMGVDDKTEDNLGLQICLDLLTRELSSAVTAINRHHPCQTSSPSFTSSPHSPDSGTSTLQVWTMIEAYERLRDKMAGMSGTNGRARSMEKMFDSWLGALYSVHGSLKKNGGEFVGARDGRRSGDNGIKQRLERSEKHRGMRGGRSETGLGF
ncbi:hypothetical protein B0J18DRAFT_468362 [Chaetomium sp. MPI-SDFR-AT-0129]|nr:hypothetical protein B0J18DRAFT_468362 [Chaetomium sp. MPI-SDFR-AT-0129]